MAQKRVRFDSKVKFVDINEVKPNRWNPNVLPERHLDQMVKDVKRKGFVGAIICREKGKGYEILDGEHRWRALKIIGAAKCPVILVDYDDTEARLATIRFNRLRGELDMVKLSDLMVVLDKRLGEDVTNLLSFDAGEVENLLSFAEAPDVVSPVEEVETPSLPEKAFTKKGGLWILGDHRLLCGDAALKKDVDRLVDGEMVHLVNTDPPYNVQVEPRSNNAIAAAKKGRKHHQKFDLKRHPSKSKATGPMRPRDRALENDWLDDKEFEALLMKWFGNIARVLQPGRSFYIWGGYANCANYPPALKANDLYFSQAIIWVKEHPVLTRKDFMGNHEWCFYGWRKGAAHYFNPKIHNATDVWSVKKVNPQSMIHLTEKPIELAVRAMEYSSKRGENVLDLFGGSGSTLMGAEQIGRRSFLMEIDPAYCDVIVRRWEKFTGAKARTDKGRKMPAEAA